MVAISLSEVDGVIIDSNLFSGNFLSTKDRIGDQGTFDETSTYLGVTNFRYPGGSLTEHYFDIKNPNSTHAWCEESNRWVFLTPISDFIEFAKEQDASVTIVLPTKKFLSDNTDSNGDRYAEIDAEGVVRYVTDLITGQYGDVNVQAFEIGNEYWGSGEMSSVEYGRVASEMSVVIQRVLNDLGQSDTDIVVQVGSAYMHEDLPHHYDADQDVHEILEDINSRYGVNFGDEMLNHRGEIQWGFVTNGLIMNEFDTVHERLSIDAIASHVYSRAPFSEYSRDYHLDIADKWHDEISGLTNYVTEWNVSSNTSLLERQHDYGLKQAHEYLNLITNFAERNVEVAHIWGVEQAAEAALARNNGDVTVLGEMYSLMNESIPDAQIIDISAQEHNKQLKTDVFQANAFLKDDTLVMFVSSLSTQDEIINLDVSALVESYGEMKVKTLKVESAADIGNADAEAIVAENPANVMFKDGLLTIDSSPYEVVRVEFLDVELPDLDGAEDDKIIGAVDTSLDYEELGSLGDDNIDAHLHSEAKDDKIIGAVDKWLDDEDLGLVGDDGIENHLHSYNEEDMELMVEAAGLAGLTFLLPILLFL